MSVSLSDDLATIEEWLQENAPVSHRTLRPGLEPAGLAALENRYGFPLHSQLRTLLSWHDGCEPSARAFQIWTDFVFEKSDFMYQLVHDLPDDCWDPHWVPYATDVGLKRLVVDHQESPGRVMLFDAVDGMYEDRTWPSIGSMIAEVRKALTSSSPLRGRRAVIENGALYWSDIQ